MPDANELLRIQHEVTSERDPERRLAAIERAYVEDLKFLVRYSKPHVIEKKKSPRAASNASS